MPEEPLPPGKEGAVVAVQEITLHGVGLALEGDVSVGQMGTAILDEAEEPLQDVPDEEKHVEHLALL